MNLSKRFMSRSNWLRVPDRDYTYMMINSQDFKGAIGLLKLKEVTEPAIKIYDTIPVKIIDKDYYWLQIAPENQNYWITVMYNQSEEIVQYYFDITEINTILDNGESWFYDLFLDIVVLPDGRQFLLDEDELEQALNNNEITKDQFDKAYLTVKKLMNQIEGKVNELNDMCNTYFNKLKLML